MALAMIIQVGIDLHIATSLARLRQCPAHRHAKGILNYCSHVESTVTYDEFTARCSSLLHSVIWSFKTMTRRRLQHWQKIQKTKLRGLQKSLVCFSYSAAGEGQGLSITLPIWCCEPASRQGSRESFDKCLFIFWRFNRRNFSGSSVHRRLTDNVGCGRLACQAKRYPAQECASPLPRLARLIYGGTA